jgi:general secretion pathway protein G
MDPWGHAYQYHLADDHNPPYEIKSLGPDGRGGGMTTAADTSHVQR